MSGAIPETKCAKSCDVHIAYQVVGDGPCPDCGGRLRLVATIADPRVIARILAHLGLPLLAPCPVPPRQPSWLSSDAN